MKAQPISKASQDYLFCDVDLSEIKTWLQRGDIKAIAKLVGVDPSYASLVLSGKHVNHDVIHAALDKAIERKAAYSGKIERLKQL